MTEEVNAVDETANFETTTSDLPVEQQVTEPEEVSATSEDDVNASSDDNNQSGNGEKAETEKEESQDTTAEKPKKGGFQKRIDKVVREREQERREKEQLQKRIAELEAKDKSKSETKEPQESDFESYDDYLNALEKFDNDSETKEEVKAETEVEDNESQLTESQQTAMAVLRENIENAEIPDDFESVALNPELPITGDMLEALAECDDPSKLMYHLGKNKELTTEIAGKSPAQQMRAIAQLELTVTSKPPKPTKTTQAPDPISPVGGSDAQQKNVSDMSFAEYEKHMNAKTVKQASDW